MVDFKKRLQKKSVDKKINPLDLYESLDRLSDTGPLRESQLSLLKEWYQKYRNRRDNIIKLHTGEGKTLIGLLILLSKLSETNEPCLYLCPNKYLASQVKLEARKFGIPFCELDKDNNLPDEFLIGKGILICHVQLLFNGKTKFGLYNKSISIGSIVLDDSHACIDAIKASLTIRIKNPDKNSNTNVNKASSLYFSIINLFEQDIKDQGEGSFLEIKAGSYTTMLPIPYWSWIDRKEEITALLLAHRDEVSVIGFSWELIKDNIEYCQCFISGEFIEISPILTPINAFGSFARAKNRVLMSATTHDDAFAIKGLGFELEAIQTPLTNSSLKWSGEKMILIPSLIDQNLDREKIIQLLTKRKARNFGIVFLTPSFNNKSQYERYNIKVADTSTIFEYVQQLKSGDYSNDLVFVNRYDGIDLPDAACRILILDSKPYFDSLLDRYEEDCRINSDVINIKVAQRIEQGLGRSVRGEKDYSIILIIGGELVKFIKSSRTLKYFSNQTRKQIEISLQTASFAEEEIDDGTEPSKVLINLMQQALSRDSGWKEFYVEEMSKLEEQPNSKELLEILKKEFDAETAFISGEVEKACKIIQSLCDKFGNVSEEKGWYLQQLARYRYKISKSESNETQLSAFKLNSRLLKPKNGVKYTKISFIHENRLLSIKKWLTQFQNYEELHLAASEISDNLRFGIPSEKFEQALKQLGEASGFSSQRPDKEFKKGPDNLWCTQHNEYILLECKNEVEETRSEINKDEAGQMNCHCGWFQDTYGNAKCQKILIIPVLKLSKKANFTHDIRIVRKNGLKKLRDNFNAFIRELYKYNLDGISDTKIQELLEFHHLGINHLFKEYSEEYTC